VEIKIGKEQTFMVT